MTTMTRCRVVSIGQFAGGSFGCPGNPSRTYELFRVDCPELRQLVAQARPALADYSRFTFSSRTTAEAFARQQEVREERLEAEREARRIIGERIVAALRSEGIDVSRGVRWSDVIAGPERLTAESRAAIAAQSPGWNHTPYDAVCGSQLYRVRLGDGTALVVAISAG